jgi:hypothetical protein
MGVVPWGAVVPHLPDPHPRPAPTREVGHDDPTGRAHDARTPYPPGATLGATLVVAPFAADVMDGFRIGCDRATTRVAPTPGGRNSRAAPPRYR